MEDHPRNLEEAKEGDVAPQNSETYTMINPDQISSYLSQRVSLFGKVSSCNQVQGIVQLSGCGGGLFCSQRRK